MPPATAVSGAAKPCLNLAKDQNPRTRSSALLTQREQSARTECL